SIKTIETLKQQLLAAQATSRENLSGAANAQAKLAASEGSWKQRKRLWTRKLLIRDNARSLDLSAQNALLHQHLETVSTQAMRIRQAVDSSAMEGTSGDVDVGGVFGASSIGKVSFSAYHQDPSTPSTPAAHPREKLLQLDPAKINIDG
ncbi:hypothetical protein BDR06DRAFT_1015784, partial [Suillus hirtellus]